MAITPTVPIELPALPERVADKYWLQSLHINAPNLTEKAEVIAILIPYNSETGEMFYDKKVVLYIDDVLTKAETDSTLANTCNVIFTEIDRQAKAQGLI